MSKYWIGVDFDGTLAYTIIRDDPYTLGPPVPIMVERVKKWISEGKKVKLMTARMCAYSHFGTSRDLQKMEKMLRNWCKEHLGTELECTNQKDGFMLELWDDRAVSVVKDTGIVQSDWRSI